MLIAVLVIGAGLLAFGGTMGQQVEKTGEAVASWTGGAIGAGDSAIESPQEKADRELAEKEPKDWTIDDQKRVAEDISANGSASKFYEKAKTAMDAGTTWSVTRTDGARMTYRIIGIAHDDKADGSGKAGLTFMASSFAYGVTSKGVWEKSDIRESLNGGKYWNLLPDELQNKVASVLKYTNNKSGKDSTASVTATEDKLFLLSYVEVQGTFSNTQFGWRNDEGTQYMQRLMGGTSYGMLRTADSIWNGTSLATDPMTQNDSLTPNWFSSSGTQVNPAFCF